MSRGYIYQDLPSFESAKAFIHNVVNFPLYDDKGNIRMACWVESPTILKTGELFCPEIPQTLLAWAEINEETISEFATNHIQEVREISSDDMEVLEDFI